MRCVRDKLFAGCIVLAVDAFSPAQAAKIELIPGEADEPSILSIEGDLDYGDEQKVFEKALRVPRAIVMLGSDGGNVFAGTEIGRRSV